MGYLFGEYEIKENMVNYHKVINAAIATLATCAMLLPVAGSANADEPSNTAALGAGYTATKISHPNAGLGENDGIVNVLNGESTDDLTQGEAERVRTIRGLRSVMAIGCTWAPAIPQWVPR